MAKKALESKLDKIQHSLIEDLDNSSRATVLHALKDLVMSHDDLSLAIYSAQLGGTEIVRLGKQTLPPHAFHVDQDGHPTFHSWSDEVGTRYLTISKLLPFSEGELAKVFLTLDRSEDEILIALLLKTTLFSLPAFLGLIGVGTWWIVQKGLSPLVQFSHTASLVSTTNLAHRIPTDELPSELAELALAINFMLHRLDDGVQQLSQFSDDLAHELRSPIANLMGIAQVTLTKERSREEYKAVLECCVEELSRVSQIVSDMLFLAQASNPSSTAPFKHISLTDETKRVIDLLSIAAEENQISLDLACSGEGDGEVLGDQLMIQRAVYNLVSNAINHCVPSSTVRITIESGAETISLSVSNSGKEIPQQHIPHLFERFYRVDPARSRTEGGTGLGLAIVKSIMSLHKGTTEVESMPEGMTVFRLCFPALSRHGGCTSS